ncbi:MAG: lipopolysaccharide heptosyltransferase family protein, partial [Ignavibacteria bacterium]|nr:lipopolysaccharide heptosyltransferase family protein [Ignavibacteria bacterium]
MKQRRILISRTDRVGDVVMITPMARELKNKYPDAFIATLTQPNTSKIFYNNPNVDKIITDNLTKDSFWDVVKEIRSCRFTDGLLAYPTERAAYQMFWGGVRNRIGVGRILYEVITFMKSVSRNNYIPLRHEADYCMDLARKIGVETENIQPEIYLSDEEVKWTDEYLEKKGITNKFRMILHTGSLN